MSAPLPDGPIDTLGVLDALGDVASAVDRARQVPVDVPFGAEAGIVLIGAGPDRLVAEAARVLVAETSPVPVVVHTGHETPAFVADTWQVVLVGGHPSPETDHALAGAQAHAAPRCGVGTGPLVRSMALRGIPAVVVDAAPAGARFDFAPSLVATLRVLDRLGAICAPLGGPTLDQLAGQASQQLDRRWEQLRTSGDALGLARRLGATLPLIVASGRLGAVAARRWQDQITDNAKLPAFADWLPGMAHHRVGGWGQHGDLTRQVFSLIGLRHDHENATDVRRRPVVDELLEEVVHARHEVRAEGTGRLAQLLDLCLYGDLVSYHLAQLHEIDPGPTDTADRLRDL